MSEPQPDQVQNTEEEKVRPFTPWHYLVAAVFEFLLRPRGYQVESFIKVGQLPLEIDIVVIRKPRARTKDFERLDVIFERLGPVTVIEYKGPDDELQIDDFDRLLAYTLLYRRREGIRRYSHLTTMTISSGIGRNYRRALRAEGITLKHEARGVYHGQGAMFQHFAVAVDQLPEGLRNQSLLALGKRHQGDFAPLLRGTPTDRDLGHYLWRVYRGRKEEFMQLFTDEDLRKTFTELQKEVIGLLTAEERLEVLDLLSAEERLTGLGAEERLKGLGPDEILASLPEDVKRAIAQKLRH